MGANPFLCVFLHWCGGLASGSFYVPYKGVKKWSWETYWLVGGCFSWIICPWAFAFFMTNDLFGVLKQQSASTLWWTYFFGLLWGLGGLTYGFAPYALPGSAALGKNIAATFAKGFNCVVLENHGVVCAGDNLQRAFERFETFEFVAKTIIKASQLGEVQYLNDEQVARRNAVTLPAYTPGPASEEEKDLRGQLASFLKRGYRQRLLISTEGSFSARLTDGSMLITPSRADRGAIEAGDMVLMHDGAVESGRLPSRAARLHEAIYRRHPKFKAIVNALPVNATAFSVTGSGLDSRTIPESYLFLKDVARVPFGEQYGDGVAIAERISPENPIALVENDGVLVCGTSVLA